MAEQAPEHQDRGLFGLFGKKKEETEGNHDPEGKHDDQIMQPPATQIQNEAQTEAASYYPAAPHHGVEHFQGHGHEGQLTPEEAEQQKHTGLLGKLHRNHSSSSSSSSDEEEEGGKKKKEGGRKKKGAKDKTKEKFAEGEHHSSDQCAPAEEEKKTGLIEKIKEKLPGHHIKKDGEEEEKKQQH